MEAFKILTDEDVKNKISMATAIQLMKDAFIQISKGTATVPVRTALNSQDESGRVLFMPAYSSANHLFGVKMVSVFPENVKKGLPSIQGKMLVMDDQTGSPRGLIDAEYLTALRTGAASGVATDLLALTDAKVLAIFGTGAQAITQVMAMMQVRKIEKIIVYGTTAEKGEAFCNALKQEYKVKIDVGTKADLKRADVICTATTSSDPVFELDEMKEGVHINGIGSYKPEISEIPPEAIKASLLVVDHRDSALSEAGDIIRPLKQSLITADHIHAELGEILGGEKKGRLDKSQITVFKSVGNAVQDLVMADYLVN